jgi:hypothetical protein
VSRYTSSVGKLALVALLSGCFGYNSSAKGWAYVGDSVLIAGGAAAIGLTVTDKTDCKATGASCYNAPLNGPTIAGTILIAAGVVGIIFNATRADVKTSR